MPKNCVSLSKYIVNSSLSNEHHVALGRVQQQFASSSARLIILQLQILIIDQNTQIFIIILAAFRTDRQKKCNYSIKLEEFTWEI
jgi:hypothetical protein